MEFSYHTQVRGYELDSFAHVNHAVYLNYFEEGRWAFLRETELMPWLEEHGYFLAVVEARIRYIRECRLGDELRIITELLPGSLFAEFRQEVINLSTGDKACAGRVKTLVLNPQRQPVDFPAALRHKVAAPKRSKGSSDV